MTMMTETTIRFGVGLDRNARPIPIDVATQVLDAAKTYCLDTFGGFNLVHGEGGWADDGLKYLETSAVLTILTPHSPRLEEQINVLLAMLANGLNQAQIWWSQEQVDMQFFVNPENVEAS